MPSPKPDRLQRIGECLHALTLPAMTADEEKAYRAKVAKAYAKDHHPTQGTLFKEAA